MPLSDTLLHRIHGNVVVIASYGQMRLCGESREHVRGPVIHWELQHWGFRKGAGCLCSVPSSSGVRINRWNTSELHTDTEMRVINCQILAGMMYHPLQVICILPTIPCSFLLGLAPWDGSGNLMLCTSTVGSCGAHSAKS